MKQSNPKIKPQNPSRLRGRGVEVSKTLFYILLPIFLCLIFKLYTQFFNSTIKRVWPYALFGHVFVFLLFLHLILSHYK